MDYFSTDYIYTGHILLANRKGINYYGHGNGNCHFLQMVKLAVVLGASILLFYSTLTFCYKEGGLFYYWLYLKGTYYLNGQLERKQLLWPWQWQCPLYSTGSPSSSTGGFNPYFLLYRRWTIFYWLCLQGNMSYWPSLTNRKESHGNYPSPSPAKKLFLLSNRNFWQPVLAVMK